MIPYWKEETSGENQGKTYVKTDKIPPRSIALTNDMHSSFIYYKITQTYIMHI